MKNFKKVLALVLAVVMLLSFATVASAVTTDFYKDVDDIDYKEAVDVLGLDTGATSTASSVSSTTSTGAVVSFSLACS